MINYSLMTKEDVLQVVLLEETVLNETLGQEMLSQELDNNAAYFTCAKDGLKVIGYMSTYIVCGEAEILNFCVYEQYRRQGVGQALFNMLLAKGVNKITLEVRESNTIGKSFYLKNGFKEVGIRKNYYQNNENAIVMLKELL